MLPKIDNVWAFIKIVSIPDGELFFKTAVWCTTSYFVKILICSRQFCNPSLIWDSVWLYLRSPKGGCCLIWNDLSFWTAVVLYWWCHSDSASVLLWIKDMIESNTSASYLDLFLSIGRNGPLHASIHDKRDDFNSTSQIFRSWVAIFQLRPPMAPLSHSLYYMQGLATRMGVLFWGRHDFQINFSNTGIR